ncbi:MAG: glycerophosphodiester phosphodiesterase family protein [Candidatus Kapaibacterium sp.]
MLPLREFVPTVRQFVVGHRGSSGTAPENTLASVREALDAGADMVELDVQLTSDQEIVVFHDAVLGRTTGGKGKVAGTTLQSMQSLDAGAWFSEKFTGETVPSLRQAIALIKGKAYLNIEIKPPQPGEDYHIRLEKILACIFEEKMEEFTLFGSFHHGALAELKRNYPLLHTAAINLPNDTRLPSEIAAEIGCEGFICSMRELTHKRSKDAIAHGIYLGVYTVNTREDVDFALGRKAKAIATNFPARIREEILARG